MQLDEKKIKAYAKSRDWYITIQQPGGKLIVVFRQHSLEIKDAEEFKVDEVTNGQSQSFAHAGQGQDSRTV